MSKENDDARTDFANAIGGAARDNPLPAALIGMGLGWLFAGGRVPLKNGLGAAASGLSALGGRFNEQVAPGRSIADTATPAADSARTGVTSMASAVQPQPAFALLSTTSFRVSRCCSAR